MAERLRNDHLLTSTSELNKTVLSPKYGKQDVFSKKTGAQLTSVSLDDETYSTNQRSQIRPFLFTVRTGGVCADQVLTKVLVPLFV